MVEVNFKPVRNYMDKNKYVNTTAKFTIEDFVQDDDGVFLVLNDINTQEDNVVLRSPNHMLVALQKMFGNETNDWNEKTIAIEFKPFTSTREGVSDGVSAKLVQE